MAPMLPIIHLILADCVVAVTAAGFQGWYNLVLLADMMVNIAFTSTKNFMVLFSSYNSI